MFTAYDVVGTLWILAAAAAYVANCLWLWSARQNAEAMGTHAQRLPRAWVWTGWIVPIVQLWVPFQIVRDVRRATRDRSDNVLLRLWWTGWLAFLFVSAAAEPAFATSALAPVETAGALLAIFAGTLWCMTVRRIVREQEAVILPSPDATG
jgi:hypothetical protein